MREPKWLNELSVVLLHAESVAEHGGSEGLRDRGLLQSALARARNLYVYEGVTEVAHWLRHTVLGLPAIILFWMETKELRFWR